MVKSFLSTFVYEIRHLSNKGFKLANSIFCKFLSAFDLHNVEDVGKNKKTVRI